MNIQKSILSKKETFWESIDFYQPDFIIGCETWLNSTVFDTEILPENYKVYRKGQADGNGGVLIGVKDTFPSSLISISIDTELCAAKIKKT